MRPLRNPFIQRCLSYVLSEWLRFCYATIRWTHENQEVAEEIWDQGGGVLLAFWHSRLALGIASCRKIGPSPPRP